MRSHLRRFLALVAALAAVSGAVALVLVLRLRTSVDEALATKTSESRPLQFVAVPRPARRLERWGSGEIESVAATATGLWVAGGSGIEDERGPLAGLPTLRVSVLALWRGQPVAALAAGDFFRWTDGGWEQARSAWGALHVRALAETPGGELLVGAREGLFRVAWGAPSMDRLETHPVRALALGPGFVLAGGEEGLHRVEPSRTTRLETPDAWVESVALSGDDVLVVTAAGLARGPLAGPLAPVAGGGDLVSGVLHEGAFYGIDGHGPAVFRLDLSGRTSEEILPSPPRRLMTSGGLLCADTAEGLCRRRPGGWTLVRRRPPSLPGSAHVSALAWLGSRLVAGLFDGGLAAAEVEGARLDWQLVAGSSAWGVNALLPAGGALYVASLRGAARFDGTRLTPLEGPGAAFALAATRDGVAVGYGQGVLLPGPRLLSAFHGLPGNQALALAAGPELYVGTPSGLGAVEGRRVVWRVAQGEGKLPHSWITALALSGDTLYVGTYGGGVVRRSATGAGGAGRFEPFVETEGLKVNAGCLLEAAGRLYLGTDGAGLYRLSRDRARFERLPLDLPSPRVTALVAAPDTLYIGTDEGLARLPLASGSEERSE